MDNKILFAFTLTLLAGLSTSIGGFIGAFSKKESTKLLSIGLGFSAGVMIYVSFVEILKKAEVALAEVLSVNVAQWSVIAAFFIGILIAALVDKLLPSSFNQDDLNLAKDFDKSKMSKEKLKRMGLFTSLAIAMHNFPEGLATFVAALSDPALGGSIAVAIAIHNIPEGIAVALPIYHATGSRKKAFAYSSLSGLAEPLGAIIGFSFLQFFFNGAVMGLLFGIIAGIMIYISFDELLPAAREYDRGHSEIGGLVLGMFIMAVSLQFLK